MTVIAVIHSHIFAILWFHARSRNTLAKSVYCSLLFPIKLGFFGYQGLLEGGGVYHSLARIESTTKTQCMIGCNTCGSSRYYWIGSPLWSCLPCSIRRFFSGSWTEACLNWAQMERQDVGGVWKQVKEMICPALRFSFLFSYISQSRA